MTTVQSQFIKDITFDTVLKSERYEDTLTIQEYKLPEEKFKTRVIHLGTYNDVYVNAFHNVVCSKGYPFTTLTPDFGLGVDAAPYEAPMLMEITNKVSSMIANGALKSMSAASIWGFFIALPVEKMKYVLQTPRYNAVLRVTQETAKSKPDRLQEYFELYLTKLNGDYIEEEEF